LTLVDVSRAYFFSLNNPPRELAKEKNRPDL